MALSTVASCALSATNLLATPAADRKIALQMYTLRNVGSLEAQLFLAQNSGFSAVELVGDQGVSRDELNRLLKKYNLTVTSAHVQMDALRRQLAETIAFNRAVGNRSWWYLICSHKSGRPMRGAGKNWVTN
ncbi:hypothetical protein [Pseudomonas sp. P105]|uniref:hypothetical protein n=1 Tax=Pseudomonas sp. P105 TaxID=3049542 RepID=UPI00293443E2|nr:hypothetical protein [Pseudomonas sp. P105]WNZ80888.1 hypothetical protein QOM08_12580 [Pseudomonas sp. P105]